MKLVQARKLAHAIVCQELGWTIIPAREEAVKEIPYRPPSLELGNCSVLKYNTVAHVQYCISQQVNYKSFIK
jgi:hypothetical protein